MQNSFLIRYGGLSVGGQLPVLDLNPNDVQNVFHQLGRMLNITGVILVLDTYCRFQSESSQFLMSPYVHRVTLADFH